MDMNAWHNNNVNKWKMGEKNISRVAMHPMRRWQARKCNCIQSSHCSVIRIVRVENSCVWKWRKNEWMKSVTKRARRMIEVDCIHSISSENGIVLIVEWSNWDAVSLSLPLHPSDVVNAMRLLLLRIDEHSRRDRNWRRKYINGCGEE